MIDIEELQRMEQGVPLGPWRYEREDKTENGHDYCLVSARDELGDDYAIADTDHEPTAAFICAIRNELPELLNELADANRITGECVQDRTDLLNRIAKLEAALAEAKAHIRLCCEHAMDERGRKALGEK